MRTNQEEVGHVVGGVENSLYFSNQSAEYSFLIALSDNIDRLQTDHGHYSLFINNHDVGRNYDI